MKLLSWLLVVLAWYHSQVNIDIGKVRILYRQASLTKLASRQFSTLLSRVDSSYQPSLQCYKGASIMMEAKYAVNPFVKWEKFTKGKNLIQSAISRDSLDIEMRFIRLSLQINLPAFLGYNKELTADKRFLQQHTSESADIELKKMITQYLISLPHTKPADKYN